MDESARISDTADVTEAAFHGTSELFVGRWNRLVSTTNWEKGRIISQWRETLIAANAPHVEYSDDAWSRQVEGVTGQHVGRLRRVFQRFGHVAGQYDGLYWSHFQAALDWDDAEMWLEGALQNGWSVARMRRTRWETMGAVAEQEPREEETGADVDEDFAAIANGSNAEAGADRGAADVVDSSEVEDELPLVGAASTGEGETGTDEAAEDGSEKSAVTLVRPFADIPDLPPDLSEAFDQFKLAILHHKTDGWQQTTAQDVLNCLDALKQLALAPSSEDAPF